MKTSSFRRGLILATGVFVAGFAGPTASANSQVSFSGGMQLANVVGNSIREQILFFPPPPQLFDAFVMAADFNGNPDGVIGFGDLIDLSIFPVVDEASTVLGPNGFLPFTPATQFSPM